MKLPRTEDNKLKMIRRLGYATDTSTVASSGQSVTLATRDTPIARVASGMMFQVARACGILLLTVA